MDPPRQIPPSHPGSSQTVQYPIWPFQILQTIMDPSRPSWTRPDVSGPSQTILDPPRPFWTLQDGPWLFQIVLDPLTNWAPLTGPILLFLVFPHPSLKNISAAVSSPWLKSGRLHVLYSDLKVEDAVESFFFCCNPWRTLSLPSAWMCRSWSCWPVLYTILILLPLIPFKNYLVASWPIFCPHTHITALMISFSLVSFGTFLLFFSIYNPQ